MDFNDSLLLVSARSPFARRVRMAFRENGIRYEERVVDVFKPTAELLGLNPLARVPTLRLNDGSVLIESEKILVSLYRSLPRSPLVPATEASRASAEFWSGVAIGLCDKAVEYYLDTLRPEGARDEDLHVEVREIAARSIERFDAFIGTRESIVDGQRTQADFDMTAALAYFTLRYSDQWQSRFSHAADFLRRMEELPSVRDTRPPLPT